MAPILDTKNAPVAGAFEYWLGKMFREVRICIVFN